MQRAALRVTGVHRQLLQCMEACGVHHARKTTAAQRARRESPAPPTMRVDHDGLLLVADLARAGVDCISVGALTHSAPAADIGLDFEA